MNTTTMELIHYGATEYIPENFIPVKDVDRYFSKPDGGLWTSPVDCEFGWKQWCEAEEFHTDKLSRHFKLRFTGRLLVIDCESDLCQLRWEQPKELRMFYPLWEPSLHAGFDAIYLTERGERATRLTHPRSLYGWDCETVFVMNPASITAIKKDYETNIV